MANLQPIPQYEESITDHSVAMDVVLPSSEGFMQTNKFSEPSETNEARQLINNWLSDNHKNEGLFNNEISAQQQMTLAQSNSIMPHENV